MIEITNIEIDIASPPAMKLLNDLAVQHTKKKKME